MHPLLNIAVRAARSAGTLIERQAQQLDNIKIEQKSKNDFVSEVDKLAENEIVNQIYKAYPEHAILTEESGLLNEGKDDIQWIIDPIDGTTNFIHGLPHYAISIACKVKDNLEVGLVYNPKTDELFSATRGEGAMLNNRRIRVSKRLSLDGALIGVGIPFSPDRDFDAYLQQLRQFMGQPAGIRRAGSSALDMAYVASGRLDAYWEERLQPWDIAAGILLVKESGGLVGDFQGNNTSLESGDVVCGNPKIFSEVISALKKA